jgi:hypothetical protein
MRWENIERDSLDWSYERSDDGGETWTELSFGARSGIRESGFRSH